MYNEDFFDYGPDFEEFFQAGQARKWASGEYVDHCANCDGEDCPCCQYNPNLQE